MSFAQVATPRGGARPALPRPVRPQSSSRVRAAPPEKASGKIEPPSFAQVPGLREFAAALQTRRRHIPSQTYADPLMRLFDEFDTDHDGRLTAAEVAAALKSRQVDLSEDLAQLYIDGAHGLWPPFGPLGAGADWQRAFWTWRSWKNNGGVSVRDECSDATRFKPSIPRLAMRPAQ
ncbi:unnamed protein product [Ostreobium quekettii]|uniref:EF-hand domain-containing protein n=1 Tax=Ostreobium quekettii TaxID=121088 RepID=A0A8S1J5G2_9CHLO|nr:unnamed protein product [Ostreobium quekettii]